MSEAIAEMKSDTEEKDKNRAAVQTWLYVQVELMT